MELDWQRNHPKINKRGEHLLVTGLFSDCQFLVGTEKNQRLFSAHKLILAMASPVFERMFYGILMEENYPILVTDVEPTHFQAMLEYIYMDSIVIGTFKEACDLFYVAKKYMLVHLEIACTDAFVMKITPANACRGYEFAKLFDDPELIECSKWKISSETRKVLKNPSFNYNNITTIIDIFDEEYLNINSELDLFNALTNYAMKRMQSESHELAEEAKVNLEPPVESGGKQKSNDVGEIEMKSGGSANTQAEDRTKDAPVIVSTASLVHRVDKEFIRKALKKIRFLSLSAREFADGPARSKLFQQEEITKIFLKLLSSNPNSTPMPDGFSEKRRKRARITYEEAY